MNRREFNNNVKREFLNKWVHPSPTHLSCPPHLSCPTQPKVLDIGCGQGGDLHKWKALNVKLTGVDPNPLAIKEARKRAKVILPSAKFKVGTILDVLYSDAFDYVCYNFSMQYEDPKNYKFISTLLNPGGYLIGIIPDPDRFEYAKDDGIVLEKISEKEVSVWIADTPYYANGAISEPIVTKHKLIDGLAEHGFNLVFYGESFSMYSKFVFQKNLL
jgi:SAM-dependent methyltransferase